MALALACSSAFSQIGGLDIERRRSFTPGELALLPEICKDIHGMPTYDGPRGDYWRSIIGDTLQHMHHYCRGVRDMIFARTLSMRPEHKRLLWDRAAGEMQYVIKNSPPTMMLQPELWMRYGEAQLELGNVAAAQAGFEQSRKLKPDYWPAYTAWADFLIHNKRFDDARAVIDLGLQNAPNTPQLMQRRDRIAQQR